MTSVLQKAEPTRLEDLIAINALYRPGPMAIIPEWLAAKHMPEDQRPYPDPRLKSVLAETYGFMIYQEQVMQCAQIIAGYSLGGADLLRRAMGHKKPEEMAIQRNIFIEGAGKNGVNEEKATHLFDLIEKFSGYGFNKSHAAAYSYLSFQTAYLKNYYPEEFFTATLNSHIEPVDTDKIAILLDDARKNGLHTSAPDVNKSFYKFSIEDDKHIRYGLGALKGVGEKGIQTIIQEREKNGAFTDFYNFLERVGKGAVNKRVMESLVKAGAFDSLHPNRAQLFNAIAEGLDYVTKFRKKELENVSVLGDSLFDDDDDVIVKPKRKKKIIELIKPSLPDMEPWDELTELKNEKSSLGHFFTSNPYITYYAKQLDGFTATVKLAQLNSYYDEGNTEVFIGGLVEEIKWWKSKKGAFVSISDGTSTVEVRMFADFINDNKEWLKPDAFVSLRLKIQSQFNEHEDAESLMLSAQQGFNFEQTKKLITNKIFIGSDNQPELIEKFNSICNEFVGSVEDSDAVAILCLPDANGRKSKKHQQVYVKAESRLYEELEKVFGAEWVKPSFKKDVDNIAFPELPNKNKKKNYNSPKRQAFSN
jgi:DNA polymerase-3 subunit alpha